MHSDRTVITNTAFLPAPDALTPHGRCLVARFFPVIVNIPRFRNSGNVEGHPDELNETPSRDAGTDCGRIVKNGVMLISRF